MDSEPKVPAPARPEESERRGRALNEIARLIAAGSLTLGSILLTVFGLIERSVGFQTLATDPRFMLIALMPGGAALAFLANARTIGSLYDEAVPPRDVHPVRRMLLRFGELEGGYGLFALVNSALVSVASGLAIAITVGSAYLDDRVRLFALTAALIVFPLALIGMLTRSGPWRRRFDLTVIFVVAALTAYGLWR